MPPGYWLALQGPRYGDRLRLSIEGDHGAVLGLASTRARLQMTGGSAATLSTRQDCGCFVAGVRMPMERAA